MGLKFTVKNYKCFEDTKPAVIHIDREYVAFVGPNNSGKSAMLKLFYEMKNLWVLINDFCNDPGNRNTLSGQSFPLVERNDFNEICNYHTSRPIAISTEILDIECQQNDEHILIGIDLSLMTAQNTIGRCNFKMRDKSNSIEEIQNELFVTGKNSFLVKLNADTKRLNTNLFSDEVSSIIRSMYIPPFRNAINQGARTYYDFGVGTTFIQEWKLWKNHGTQKQRQKILAVTEDIREILGFDRLEINADDHDGQDHKIIVNVGAKSMRLDDMGSGIAQIILVFGNAAIKNPSMIFIDEPETSFHPTLQVEFLNRLKKYTSGPIVFATHSLGLARMLAPDSTYSFMMEKGCTEVRRIEATKDYIEFMDQMSFYAFKDFGYDGILLVEGSTDIELIKMFLSKIGKEHMYLVMSLGGSDTINGSSEKRLEELKSRLTNNICCIIDSEKSSSDEKLMQDREDFKTICEKLGIRILITDRRATDNYLTDKAIKKIKGEKYTALTEYEALKDRPQFGWAKSESWKIAREMDFEDIKDTDLGKFLLEI